MLRLLILFRLLRTYWAIHETYIIISKQYKTESRIRLWSSPLWPQNLKTTKDIKHSLTIHTDISLNGSSMAEDPAALQDWALQRKRPDKLLMNRWIDESMNDLYWFVANAVPPARCWKDFMYIDDYWCTWQVIHGDLLFALSETPQHLEKASRICLQLSLKWPAASGFANTTRLAA